MKTSKSIILTLAVLLSCSQNVRNNSYTELDLINLDDVRNGVQVKDVWLVKGPDTFKVALNYLDEGLTLKIYKNSERFSGELLIGGDYCRFTDFLLDKNHVRRDYYYWDNGIYMSRVMEYHKKYGYVTQSEIEYQNRVKLWKGNWVFDLFIDSDTVQFPEPLEFQVLTDKLPEYKELLVLGRLAGEVEKRFDTLMNAQRITSRFEEKTLTLPQTGVWELKFILNRNLPITDPKAISENAFDEISAFINCIHGDSKRK